MDNLAMTTAPLVSVIIPCYNGEQYIAAAINSALSQTYSSVEVIVVNDGSTDNTAKIVNAYGERIRILHQTNRGLSSARNRGIMLATGQLIAFLDADDEWLPDKLEVQIGQVLKSPSVGLVHTDVLYLEEATGRCSPRENQRRLFVGDCYKHLFARNRIIISSVLLRRECLTKLGLFDEAIVRPTTQDYDLWMRVARHYRFEYVDRLLTKYRVHASNASSNTISMREDELYVVLKSLRDDPRLKRIIRTDQVRARLFQLYFDLGYLYYDVGRFGKAHHYFRSAMGVRPLNLDTSKLWFLTMLPPTFVGRLRRWKQHLSSWRTC